MGILWAYYKNNTEVWVDNNNKYLAEFIHRYNLLGQMWNNERTLITQMRQELVDPVTRWVEAIGHRISGILTLDQRNIFLGFFALREQGRQERIRRNAEQRREAGAPQAGVDPREMMRHLAQLAAIREAKYQQAREVIIQVLPLAEARIGGLVEALKEITRLTARSYTIEELKNRLRSHMALTSGEEAQIDPHLERVMDILFPRGWERNPQGTS